MGPAEAVLSTIGAKSSAYAQAEARKSRATEGMFDSVSDLAGKIGEFPVLLRKGKEEREEKEVNDAALAGYMHGGLDGMRDAAMSVPTTTPGGSRARLGALMRHSTMSDQALTLAAKRRQMEHEDAAEKATSAYFDNKPVLDMGAMRPMSMGQRGALAGGDMPAMGAPPQFGVPMRAPTTDERLSRMGATPGVRFSDLSLPFLDAQRRDMAKDADAAKDERKRMEIEAKATQAGEERKIKKFNAMERMRHNLASEGIDIAAEGGRNTRAKSERQLKQQLAEMANTTRNRIADNADAVREYAVEMSEYVANNAAAARAGALDIQAAKARLDSADRVTAAFTAARRKELSANDEADVSMYDEELKNLKLVRDALHKQLSRAAPTGGGEVKPGKPSLKAAAAPPDLTPDEQAAYDSLDDAGKAAFMEALK